MVRMILVVGDAIVVKGAKWELLKIKKFEIELSHLSAYTICMSGFRGGSEKIIILHSKSK